MKTPSGGTTIRHGTRHGYRDDRCKCEACKKAIALEHNVYKLRRAANGGEPLTVDKTGAVRRLQALMVMGWPRRELARQAGYEGDAFALILNGRRSRLTLDTHRRICDLYDRLSMTPGPSNESRIRNAKKGWLPPLAWDDDTIDDPKDNDFYNKRIENISPKEFVDPVVIERILGGEGDVPASLAEKREVVRRWTGTRNELERLTGWNVQRYIDRSVRDSGDREAVQDQEGAA